MRTARSRTSGENLFDFFMAQSSQRFEPPQNTGRFKTLLPSLGVSQQNLAYCASLAKNILIRHTDLDIAISNQCGRLLANVVIAYSSVVLSVLLDRYRAEGNVKALAMLKKILPVVWQHIHFLEHYAFRDKRDPVDIEALLANIFLL